MALGGQSPGLHRVREDHRRAVCHLICATECVEQHAQVVPAQVADCAVQLGVVDLGEQGRELPACAPRFRQAFAHILRRRAQQALVLLVRHLVDAAAHRVAAGSSEQFLEA
jgi:hypothetical protein